MTTPIRTVEDFRFSWWAERILFSLVLLIGVCIITALTLATWLVQLIVSISEDPNAGPYRQVR